MTPTVTTFLGGKAIKVLIIMTIVFCLGTSASFALEMCRHDKATKTCLVDGDTIWLKGVKYRLEGFDTPEPTTNLCGGDFERQLAAKASARLLHILNSYDWTIEASGKTGRFGRALATIRVGGQDVGDVLISERLARRWPDGEKWWCQ